MKTDMPMRNVVAGLLAAVVLTSCSTAVSTPPAAPTEPASAGTVTTYLDSLRSLADPLDFSGAAEINGVNHPHSIGAEFCPPVDDREWQYNLARDYQSFKATIGLDDTSNNKGIVRFAVYCDDQLTYSKDVGFGATEEIAVPVLRVLRLRLVSTVLAAGGCAGTKARWGEARVEGLAGQVPATN